MNRIKCTFFEFKKKRIGNTGKEFVIPGGEFGKRKHDFIRNLAEMTPGQGWIGCGSS
jgi:hypothetical protein